MAEGGKKVACKEEKMKNPGTVGEGRKRITKEGGLGSHVRWWESVGKPTPPGREGRGETVGGLWFRDEKKQKKLFF